MNHSADMKSLREIVSLSCTRDTLFHWESATETQATPSYGTLSADFRGLSNPVLPILIDHTTSGMMSKRHNHNCEWSGVGIRLARSPRHGPALDPVGGRSWRPNTGVRGRLTATLPSGPRHKGCRFLGGSRLARAAGLSAPGAEPGSLPGPEGGQRKRAEPGPDGAEFAATGRARHHGATQTQLSQA